MKPPCISSILAKPAQTTESNHQMKTALFAFTALSVIAFTFVLVGTGALHPFHARAILGFVIVVSIFLALLPLHKGK